VAKTKKELLAEAQAAGMVAEGVDEEEFTVAQLEALLATDKPAWEGSMSSSEPIYGVDGHPALTQEDIDARDS
jgi:hypothetical protein